MRPRPGYILAAVALAIFLVALGFRSFATANGVPLLGEDALVFLPQTVPYHERGELVNHAWKPATSLDPTGAGRMTYHGFLFPIVLSWLMWRSDYLATVGSIGVLDAVSALLLLALLASLAIRWKWTLTPGRALLILFLAVASWHYQQGVIGRPETLAALLLTTSVLLMSWTPPRWHGRIAGIGIGLITTTDPIIGVFAGIGFAAYASWRSRAARCAVELIGAGGLAVSVFALCVWLYPYTFEDWLFGTWRMGTYALTHGEEGKTMPLFLSNVRLPETAKNVISFIYLNIPFLQGARAFSSGWFLVGTFPLVLWTGLRMLRRRHQSGGGPGSPVMFYVFVGLGAFVLHKFVFYAVWATYNILPLMPLGLLLVFHELGRDREINAKPITFYRPVAHLILAIACFGFGIDVFNRACGMRFGLSLAESRELFAPIRAEFPDAMIALPDNMVTLTEDFSKIVFWLDDIPAHASILVDAQTNRREEQPVEFEGFRLIRNHFQPERPTVLGVPVSRFDRGCGFAVYQREPLKSSNGSKEP